MEGNPGAGRDSAVGPAAAVVLSVAFWLCLFAAGGIVAAVALASRIVVQADLEREYSLRQGELLAIEEEVAQDEWLVSQLKSHPEQAEQFARSGALSGAEGRASRLAGPQRGTRVEFVQPWYVPIARELDRSAARRWRWLSVAGGLVLFGFVFLHERGGTGRIGRAFTVPWRVLAARYARSGMRDRAEE